MSDLPPPPPPPGDARAERRPETDMFGSLDNGPVGATTPERETGADQLYRQVVELRSTLGGALQRLTDALDGLRAEVRSSEELDTAAIVARLDRLHGSAGASIDRLVEAVASVGRRVEERMAGLAATPVDEGGGGVNPLITQRLDLLLNRFDEDLRPIRNEIEHLRRRADASGEASAPAVSDDLVGLMREIRDRLATVEGADEPALRVAAPSAGDAAPQRPTDALAAELQSMAAGHSEALAQINDTLDRIRHRLQRFGGDDALSDVTAAIERLAGRIDDLDPRAESRLAQLERTIVDKLDEMDPSLELIDIRASVERSAAAATDLGPVVAALERVATHADAVDVAELVRRGAAESGEAVAELGARLDVLAERLADDNRSGGDVVRIGAAISDELRVLRETVEANAELVSAVNDPDLGAHLARLVGAIESIGGAGDSLEASRSGLASLERAVEEAAARRSADVEALRGQISAYQEATSERLSVLGEHLASMLARERERLVSTVSGLLEAGGGGPPEPAGTVAVVDELEALRAAIVELRSRHDVVARQLSGRLDQFLTSVERPKG